MKPKLYIESSVVSYYVARRSRDVFVLARQELTRTWWQEKLAQFEPFVSEIVVEEIRQGDSEMVAQRVKAIEGFPILAANSQAKRLTSLYLRHVALPATAARDATRRTLPWHRFTRWIIWLPGILDISRAPLFAAAWR
jgi:hypothetical protein